MESVENERRLAKMEADLVNIKELLLEIRNQPYVPRQELNEMFARRDERLQKIEETTQNAKTLWAAWGSVIVAIVAIVISFIK